MNRIWYSENPGLEDPVLRIVLISLADNANDHGYCFPSLETIRKRCGCKLRTVQNKINVAIKIGVLKKRTRKDASNEYFFQLDQLPHVARPRGHKELSTEEYYKQRFGHVVDEQEQDLFGTAPPAYDDIDTGVPPAYDDVPPLHITTAPPAYDDTITLREPKDITPILRGAKNKEEILHFSEMLFVSQWLALQSEYPVLPGMANHETQLMGEGRRKLLAARFKDAKIKTGEEAADFLNTLFEIVAKSPLLLGLTTDWNCHAAWILRPTNITKIMEKTYVRPFPAGSGRSGNRQSRNLAAGRKAADSRAQGRSGRSESRGHSR